jgi:hypothetical protein
MRFGRFQAKSVALREIYDEVKNVAFELHCR